VPARPRARAFVGSRYSLFTRKSQRGEAGWRTRILRQWTVNAIPASRGASVCREVPSNNRSSIVPSPLCPHPPLASRPRVSSSSGGGSSSSSGSGSGSGSGSRVICTYQLRLPPTCHRGIIDDTVVSLIASSYRLAIFMFRFVAFRRVRFMSRFIIDRAGSFGTTTTRTKRISKSLGNYRTVCYRKDSSSLESRIRPSYISP